MTKSAKKIEKNEGVAGTLLAQLMLPLAEIVRGDLRELVIALGMRAVAAMIEEERTALCGPRYRHDPERRASRGGTVPSELTLGGRKVAARRPRVVGPDGEIPLTTWQELAATDPLGERALEQMMIGVATRKYARSLEPLPPDLEERGTTRSSVSRRFVDVTMKQMREWMERPLGELDLKAIFIDGIHFSEHVILIALGVDANGTKHVLGLWEGATENGAACRALLSNLTTRGVKDDRALLFVIDGSQALRAAIRDVFGSRALVQRCQVHKIRNVLSHLPDKKHDAVRATMRQAYKSATKETAKKQLENLARTIAKAHPSAAASLREGLDETLTVIEIGLPNALTRSFSTTNPIESLNDRVRASTRRVKRWRGGEMILRWVAASVIEASRGFRRLKGHRDMPKLVAALAAHDARLDRQTKRLVDDVRQVA